MKEVQLHRFWSTEYLKGHALHTSDGRSLSILKAGNLNDNAGPDFLNSMIKLDGLTWVGNIEIHINTSDWIKHKHNGDKSYEKIVLHVVFNNDIQLKNRVPTLVLNTILSEDDIFRIIEKAKIEKNQVSPLIVMDKNIKTLYLRRLQRKEEHILKDLKETRNDWQEVLYRSLARAFGFSVNAIPFEALARSLPLSVLRRHMDDLFDVESLIFGQSSLLNDSKNNDRYCQKLKYRYQSFRYKYNLDPINESIWKFSKMRPLNFPTIRLAQFTSLMCNYSQLVKAIFTPAKKSEIYKTLEFSTSDYWKSHYTFQKKSREISKVFGKKSKDNIYLNSIVPFLSVYENFHGISNRFERSLERMKTIKVEDNKFTRSFTNEKVNYSNALESQAIVELSLNYNV